MLLCMKKLICYSLWGTDKLYNFGMLENVILSETIYPDWIVRIYYGSCDPLILSKLKTFRYVELIEMDLENLLSNSMWRFLPAFNEDCIMLFRDADSRISMDEKNAVDEWLKSDKDFHIMRDNIAHRPKIMGGLWGCRNGILIPLKNTFQEYFKRVRGSKLDRYGVDQIFLRDVVYPYIYSNSFVHASPVQRKYEPHAKDFPTRISKNFMGEKINIYDEVEKLLNEKDCIE